MVEIKLKINRIFKFIIAIVIMIFTGIVIYYNLYLYYDEELSCRITEDVTVINGLFSSMYLVKTDSGYIAFDAGFDEDVIKRGLHYNNISPADIHYLFLTHTDTDHQSAVKLFYRAKVYLPEREFRMIKERIPRFAGFPFIFNEIKTDSFELLAGDSILEVSGRKIRCIALPGHTEGSMGYLVDDKYLFSGDAFRLKNGRLSVPLKKYFTMNLNVMESSLNKTAALKKIKYVFTAHSGFTGDFNFAVGNWKK